MGVEARIVLYAEDEPAAVQAAASAFDRIAQLDASMSDYRPDSEINRLAAVAPTPVRISDDLLSVLTTAQTIARHSDGAFDPTVGPVVALWRAARRTGTLPDANELAEARRLVNWRKLTLDPELGTARLEIAGMKLDLGAIAKGYAAGQAVQTLQSRGINRCLVALAGDVAAGGPPPEKNGWRVAVTSTTSDQSARVLLLANQAVSTSGDLEQHVEIDGRRYSHIIDPRTGVGLTNRASATVVAPRGELADALSTAVCVVGAPQGTALLGRFRSVAAIIPQETPWGVEETIIDPGQVFKLVKGAAPWGWETGRTAATGFRAR